MHDYNGYEIRRLVRNVPNPRFDRRCKYGTEAVETFKAGWLVWIPKSEQAGSVHRIGLHGQHSYSIAWPEWQAILDASETMDGPANAAEALELYAGLDTSWGTMVLDRMLKAGVVTMEQIKYWAEDVASEDEVK